MAKLPKGELVPVVVGFNYDLLEAKVGAGTLQCRPHPGAGQEDRRGHHPGRPGTPGRQGRRGPRSLRDVAAGGIRLDREDGTELHVGGRVFWGKSELISDLTIQPTAAYLLAAPSAPDEARQQAIERAEAGEAITTSVAKEILAETRKKRRPRREKAIPADKLALRLEKYKEKYKEKWNQKELSELARQLREFPDDLEKPQTGGRKKGKG